MFSLYDVLHQIKAARFEYALHNSCLFVNHHDWIENNGEEGGH